MLKIFYPFQECPSRETIYESPSDLGKGSSQVQPASPFVSPKELLRSKCGTATQLTEKLSQDHRMQKAVHPLSLCLPVPRSCTVGDAAARQQELPL